MKISAVFGVLCVLLLLAAHVEAKPVPRPIKKAPAASTKKQAAPPALPPFDWTKFLTFGSLFGGGGIGGGITKNVLKTVGNAGKSIQSGEKPEKVTKTIFDGVLGTIESGKNPQEEPAGDQN